MKNKALLALSCAFFSFAGFSLAAEDVVSFDRYVSEAGSMQLPDGRKVQVTCIGEGEPTAVMLAGGGAWSAGIADLHNHAAEVTRSCTIDRPGYGMSGPASGPAFSDLVNDYRDAMAAAGLRGPYVIVGHSQGGLEAVRWADLFPNDVVGIVAIDPSVPNQVALMRETAPTMADMMEASVHARVTSLNECAARLDAGETIEKGDRCLTPLRGAPFSGEMKRALEKAELDPERLRSIALQLEHARNSEFDVSTWRRDLGDIPMILLQAGVAPNLPPNVPEQVLESVAEFQAAWNEAQSEMANWSTAPQVVRVEDATHNIHLDRPDIVLEQFERLIDKVRSE